MNQSLTVNVLPSKQQKALFFKYLFALLFAASCSLLQAQTILSVYPDTLFAPLGTQFQPGVFYVPKTNEAQTDFLNNGIHQNSIRLNIIESALNNTTNLNDCIAFLDNVSGTLQTLSAKTDQLLFIFEKMPAWLSSSNDGSPATTPGWYVLNTKPPASYPNWDNAVSAIVGRIVNDYGIQNARFEIWNEPDLGSWTATKAEYFELFRHTYDAIKAVNTQIPVGGPACNYWGNNIYFQAPYGYLNNQTADLSLIGEMLDSTAAWFKPLDFISWHNFNLSYPCNANAIAYIQQKCGQLIINVPELVVSEWNAPSVIRDTPLQKAFFTKNQIEMARTALDRNMVAAWQDFSASTNEFHNDYGLLSYGSIHKPAYNALLLSNQMRGRRSQSTSNLPADLISSLSNDTLHVLIANYCPPPLVGAFDHTLYEGHFTATQLDSAGYINIAMNDFGRLDSIYQGLLSISGGNAMADAIINSIPVYAHFDSLQYQSRQYQLQVAGIAASASGLSYTIDSTENNLQYKYDSLRTQGMNQAAAIAFITANQAMTARPAQLTIGQISFALQANAVQYFQFKISILQALPDARHMPRIVLAPNPAKDRIRVQSEEAELGEMIVLDVHGAVLAKHYSAEKESQIELADYPAGIYFLHFPNLNYSTKFIKQ